MSQFNSIENQQGLPVGLGSPQVYPPVVHLGDAAFSEAWVMTPIGTVPLRGTQIFIADQTRSERYTPGWAIALAIIGFFFLLLGLLFLLVKEERVVGYVQITITNGAFTYQTMEPVVFNRAAQMQDVQNRANYARGLIMRASA
ncbi:hypothetical protein [Lysinibacter cavernae]|uniref:Uncharacterized protein n=1 Tax=Lysinibacter cavernae TaxID=1640652 RepID=A0A7X5QYB7_9MICO|nr:hypothetical protein [Lysinibacter cavernae]NIH52182.1 hypothetical protein [Lysinibacter cavernae]